MEIDRQYIVDDRNKKLAVQLSSETFEKMEEVLENYALYQLMDSEDDEVLSASEAKKFYNKLEKKK